jgi:hypothetical protein
VGPLRQQTARHKRRPQIVPSKMRDIGASIGGMNERPIKTTLHARPSTSITLRRGLRASAHGASIRLRLAFHFIPYPAERAPFYFPPSFVLIFAREPSDATSFTQAPFRFSTPLRPCRCIAVRHPCFDSTTEGGKRIFNANEKQMLQHHEGHRSTSLTVQAASNRDSSSRHVANCP